MLEYSGAMVLTDTYVAGEGAEDVVTGNV